MKHSKSALFLMELIVAILFFSLGSTVCIQLFVRSHLLSEQTVNQNNALIHAQNLTELFLSTEGDVTRIEDFFPENTTNVSNNSFVLNLNENWEPCAPSELCFTANLSVYPAQNGLIEADISIFSEDAEEEPLYKLRIVHHIAERRRNLES